MKRSLNKLVLGLVVAALAAVGAVSVMAQDDAEKTALYTKFTECYKAVDEAGMKACITAGDEYMQKYGPKDGAAADPYSTFVGKQLPRIKERLADLPRIEAYKKLDDSMKTKNWAGAFAAGRDVIRLEKSNPTKLDMTLLMAEIGYDLAFSATPDNTYNNETLGYAKSAISMIESGVVSESRPGANNTTLPAFWGGSGVYSLKNKENALAWMNLMAARLIAETNKDTARNLAVFKEAAPFYYKSTKFEGTDVKKLPIPYQNLGRYYLEELNAKVDEYDRTCKNLTEDTDQCKTIREMQLAYAERGLDAYARAAAIAKNDPKIPQAAKDSLTKRVNDFYTVRFKKTDGVTDYVQQKLAQPLADPSVPVTPIPEPAPATTTTPSTTNTTSTGTKPAATVTTPATTNGKPAATAAPASTKPAPAAPAKPAGSGKGNVAKATGKKKTAR